MNRVQPEHNRDNRDRPRWRLWWGKVRLSLGVALGVILAGCAQTDDPRRAAYILLDISDNYVQELASAQALNRYLLAELQPGDTLGAMFIDNSSYSDRNVIAQTTFDDRPSLATHQKRQFHSKVDDFVNGIQVPSAHNDITGAILLATERLADVPAGQRVLYIFSDMAEDRPPWLDRDFPIALDGVEIVAMNVTKLGSDNRSPSAYRERLADWQNWVEESGGEWRVINDLQQLERQLALR
ncbi:MAG: VWA domain-containing protein [Natronospirillum sp.]|uniref:VWA domain-containing protein n=1 Tax=Natronospirillum sp. TaxID=2812955 RepID=UPI0025DD0CE9|nr:VWA domain-containing protein [Natronospirillum sp.]MCH8551208.1 VWA domain-containing protein [Natronospirillum sp.]